MGCDRSTSFRLCDYWHSCGLLARVERGSLTKQQGTEMKSWVKEGFRSFLDLHKETGKKIIERYVMPYVTFSS